MLLVLVVMILLQSPAALSEAMARAPLRSALQGMSSSPRRWALPLRNGGAAAAEVSSSAGQKLPSSRLAAAQFALTYVVYCAVYLERKPVSLVKPMLASELELTTQQLAGIDSAWLCLYAVGQLSLGSARKVLSPRALVVLGLVLSGACTAGCARASSGGAMAACWGFNGLFQASLNPLLVLHVADLFPPTLRASAVGAWQTSQQVGGVAANLFAARTIETAGWRAIFSRAGAAAACAAVPFALFARRQEASAQLSTKQRVERPARSLLGVRSVAAAYFLVKMTRYCLMFWLPFFLVQAARLEAAQAAKLASLFDVGGALGAVSAGLVADRAFNGALLAACAPFAAATAVILLLFAGAARLGPAANAACMLAVGFCVAAPDGVLGGAAARNICDYNDVDPRVAPAVSGLVNGAGSIGAIAQGFGTSLLIDWTGWTGLFFALAASMAIATVLLVEPIRLERAYIKHLRGPSKKTFASVEA